ncbi:hypothetical protein [Dickeya poaceiphila]|uniref:Uncharacterized protein n=1 Tax=Dickeya poaceiphila TaxID=568768 RepID=A0A5B8I694_9GAMM|nr:hypothetical protein [Dickeya poaceiphila]QDX29498.1 hypothetical protein Dpoa569_0001271 [Dickeya poaceiphila]
MKSADDWLNECIESEHGIFKKRKDALDLSIGRENFIRHIFRSIQSTVEVCVPQPILNESAHSYRKRVIDEIHRAGGTVATLK